MTPPPSADIIAGIQAYLREHFPETDFLENVEPRTQSVFLFTPRAPSYRLEVTERFLDGEEGITKPLNWIREWNLARTLREANGRLVTLATTGISIES